MQMNFEIASIGHEITTINVLNIMHFGAYWSIMIYSQYKKKRKLFNDIFRGNNC